MQEKRYALQMERDVIKVERGDLQIKTDEMKEDRVAFQFQLDNIVTKNEEYIIGRMMQFDKL